MNQSQGATSRCNLGDKTVRVWDTREPTARATILAHEHEILTLDWNKYNEFVLATGAADCRVREHLLGAHTDRVLLGGFELMKGGALVV